MMVNMGSRVAPLNIAFSSSRNAGLIERKVLQYTNLSIYSIIEHWSKWKSKFLHFQAFLFFVSKHCVDQKQHSNSDFLKKSFDNTLQTCADIANEYLQAYNTGAGVKSHVFCSLHQYDCASSTMFLTTFVISN